MLTPKKNFRSSEMVFWTLMKQLLTVLNYKVTILLERLKILSEYINQVGGGHAPPSHIHHLRAKSPHLVNPI